MNRRELKKKLHSFSGSSIQNRAVSRSEIVHLPLWTIGSIFKFYTLTLHEFHAYGIFRLVSIRCYRYNMFKSF